MRILAHRGSPGTGTIENTVPAISAALVTGADGVEVDLRLTADGVLAVCHDSDLSRLTGDPLAVHTSPWSALLAAAAASGSGSRGASCLMSESSRSNDRRPGQDERQSAPPSSGCHLPCVPRTPRSPRRPPCST